MPPKPEEILGLLHEVLKVAEASPEGSATGPVKRAVRVLRSREKSAILKDIRAALADYPLQ